MFLTVDKIESFLKNFPEYPNAFLVGGPADILVIELSDQVKILENVLFNEYIPWKIEHFLIGQLQKLKVEPVLLHYFSHIKPLQGNNKYSSFSNYTFSPDNRHDRTEQVEL